MSAKAWEKELKEFKELLDLGLISQEEFDIKKKRISILENYGENFQKNNYITNPAIGRDEQIKQLILILLTPDKSAVLIGKPGVGKTATVEGLAYRIQRNLVPDVLKGYQVIKVNTAAIIKFVATPAMDTMNSSTLLCL